MNSSLSTATGIGSMAGKLPYNHLVFKGEDPRSTLVSICFQILCVVLDFQSGTAKDTVLSGADASAPTAHTNAFRYFLAKLVRFEGEDSITGLLTSFNSTGHKTSPSSLRGRWEFLNCRLQTPIISFQALRNPSLMSRKLVGFYPSLFRTISKDAPVIFFWKMIELNKVCSSPPSSQNPCLRKLRNFARTLWNPREPWTSWLTFYVMDSR